MALGGITGAWTPDAPSDTSNVGLGAGDIRSLKSNVQQPLDSEHIFPSTGGAAMGAHRPGSAMLFYGAASAVSSADTNGRFMWTSDTSRLMQVGSDGTTLAGGRYAVLAAHAINLQGSLNSSGISQFWGIENGQALMKAGSATTTVTLRRTYVTAGSTWGMAQATSAPAALTTFHAAVSSNVITITRYLNSSSTASAPAADEAVNYLVFGRAPLTGN